MHDLLHCVIIGCHDADTQLDVVFSMRILLICAISTGFSEFEHVSTKGVHALAAGLWGHGMSQRRIAKGCSNLPSHYDGLGHV